jgi:DNA-binding NarL/FixJ family response regulator
MTATSLLGRGHRLLIVGPYPIIVAPIAAAFEATGRFAVDTLPDAHLAVSATRRFAPDVVLVDQATPGGPEHIIKDLVDVFTDVRVVVLADDVREDRMLAAIEAGAIGYLLKEIDVAELVEQIDMAISRGAAFDSRASLALARCRNRTSIADELSPREREVLSFVARGWANKQIGHRLGISDRTVKAHLTKVFHLAGVSNRTEAAVWARRIGLLPDPVSDLRAS